jgi:type I restriction enzyme S subunit
MISPNVQEVIKYKSYSTTLPILNKTQFSQLEVTLPPLAEQKRIVAKLEELLPIVEQYGKAQKELDELNAALPARLRQSILQEAISGRLVPQDPNDEPASALLARIREEKARLVKEGKLKKKDLVETPITEEEIPFEIPASWEWVRLGYLVDFSKSSSVKASSISPNAWILDLEDIQKNTGVLLRKKRMGETVSISDKHQFKKGNVLYSKLRPYLNKVIIADEDGYCTSEILCFNFGEINNRYAQLFLMSAFFVDYAMKDAYGVKMPRLGSKQGNNALFPLPPLAEQQRIVAKIEELFEQIDQIKK